MAENPQEKDSASHSERFRKLKRFWPLIKNSLTVLFLAAVLWLLIKHAGNVEWKAVKQALSDFSMTRIFLGGLLALTTYAIYSCYDLFGRYSTQHGLSKTKTLMIAGVCCAFTLNLGAVIGAVAFRYRLYSRQGVSKGDIARVFGISVTTNWLGYIAVAGTIFMSGKVVMPFDWGITTLGLRLLGAVFVAVVIGYFVLSVFARKRVWDIRGQTFTLPTFKIALAQLAVSSIHWLAMGGIIYSFLYPELGYFHVVGVLLMSAIAGLITHVPGALGVLEAVFVGLLGNEVEPARLFAALIAYRAVFYFLPLAIAAIAYLGMEVQARRVQARKPQTERVNDTHDPADQ